jgi:MSHA biogenesis protein MshQ
MTFVKKTMIKIVLIFIASGAYGLLLDDITAANIYYGISHSGTGITCAVEPITITAYNSSGVAVAPPAGTVVTVSTSPATGTWSTGNTFTFGGTQTSFLKYLQQTTVSTLNINVSDGGNSESSSLDANIIFSDAALKFYGSSSFNAIPNQVAGTIDNAPILKAIKTSTTTGACVARVTGTHAVDLGYVCRNPSACITGQTFTVNGSSIQPNSNANLSMPSYTSVNLTFDATGTASIPIRYSDVGQLQLVGKLALTASGDDPAVNLLGNSNDFIVKPYTLAVSSVQTATGGANPGATSAVGVAAGFVSAGTAFQVNVEARNSAGNRTPNFGNETVSENNITLTPQSLVYPAGGALTPLTNSNNVSATTPAGTFINSTVQWNQVGSIIVRPELLDSDYLGAGNISTFTNSGTIGRFYPDHFALVSSSTANGCGAFSYMSQPSISMSYLLQAQSLTNTILTNYGTTYGTQATPSYVAENADAANGAALSSRIAATANANWINGEMNFSSALNSFNRQAVNAAPDGPYTSLQLGLDLIDSFDVRSLQSKNMNASTSGVCGVGCNAVSLGSPLQLRFGRLRLDDAFGPEAANLPVNFISEYWTGNYFALNAIDSCTLVPRAAISYPAGSLTFDANRSVNLSAGTTQGIYANLNALGVNFNAGSAGHYFSAPSVAGMGEFIVGIDLTNLNWLRYDWNQDGNYTDASIPPAHFSFGSYRGNDRIIYWREKLQ